LTLFAVCKDSEWIVESGGDCGNDVRLIDCQQVGGAADARKKDVEFDSRLISTKRHY